MGTTIDGKVQPLTELEKYKWHYVLFHGSRIMDPYLERIARAEVHIAELKSKLKDSDRVITEQDFGKDLSVQNGENGESS